MTAAAACLVLAVACPGGDPEPGPFGSPEVDGPGPAAQATGDPYEAIFDRSPDANKRIRLGDAPEKLPALTVAKDGSLSLYGNEQITQFEDPPVPGAQLGMAFGEIGYVVQRVRGDRSEIVRSFDGGVRPLVSPTSFLQDVGELDIIRPGTPSGRQSPDSPSVVYTSRVSEDRGDIIIQSIRSGAKRIVTRAFGPDLAVQRVSLGGAILAVTATVDGRDRVRFYRPDLSGGTELTDIVAPRAASGRRIAHVSLAPDGQTLAYLEGGSGEWQLVVRDLRSSTERVRVSLEGPRADLRWLSYDGYWAIVSWSGRRPVQGVDVRSDAPAPFNLTGLTGIATLAHFIEND
jgi:hypothetical protein